MSYFKIGAIAVAVIIVSLLVIDYGKTKADFERQTAELKIASVKLQEQNEAIRSMQIDIAAYKEKKPQIVEKIVNKYQTITVKDETCESYMTAIFSAQEAFFTRHKKEVKQ